MDAILRRQSTVSNATARYQHTCARAHFNNRTVCDASLQYATSAQFGAADISAKRAAASSQTQRFTHKELPLTMDPNIPRQVSH